MAGSALGGQFVGPSWTPSTYGRVNPMANTPPKIDSGMFGGFSGKGGAVPNNGSKPPRADVSAGGDGTGAVPLQGQYATLSPQGGFNVNQAAAGGLQQAMQGTQQAMGFQPQQISAATYRPQAIGSQGYGAAQAGSQGYNAARAGSQGYGAAGIAGASPIQAQGVRAGQIAGLNLGAYTNPYENQVVQQTLTDLGGAQEQALNQMGAQATAARAFGGSRQGIAEAETRKGFAKQAAQAVSGLRQAGFQNAQQLAGQDISAQMQAALANQGANLTAQGQTAANTLAAQQANQAAYNQAGMFGAGAANTAALQNQSAFNQAGQFGAGAANTAALQNQAAMNQAGQFGASAANNAAMQNQASFNQAGQFNAGAMNTAAMQNQQAYMQANQQRLAASGQMGQLGQQAFNTGQTIQQNQMQQGLMQQGLQQALIDAARGQYAGYTGSPGASLNAPLAALGVSQQGGARTQTDTRNPGLFDYLALGLSTIPSDPRLKTNITPRGTKGGIKFYSWDWNDEGKRIANPNQPTFGVMADELQVTHPHLVKRGGDGYLRVNYGGLVAEMGAA